MKERKPFSASDLPQGTYLRKKYMEESLHDVHDRIVSDINDLYPLFADKFEDARRNSRFVAGDQWSWEDIEAHKRQGRIPYVFNQITTKVNALVGSHAALRMDVRAVPAEPGDAIAADIANSLLKYAENVNHIDEIEDQVFYDEVVKGVGVTQVRWEMQDDFNGSPVVERIPIYQMMWDGASADVALEDASWMARLIPMTKRNAIEEMPEFEEEILREGGQIRSDYMTDWEIMTLRQFLSFNGNSTDRDLKDYVTVMEHYERVKQSVFLLIDEIAGDITEHETENEAVQDYEDRIEAYLERDASIMHPDGTEKVQFTEIKKNVIIQTVMIGSTVVSREVTELPDFPYQMAFCYFDDGDYWSFVDMLIHPQMFLNRMVSELDNQMGRANKNVATVVPHRLAKGFTIEDFNRERSKTSPTIPVLHHDAVNFVPNGSSQTEIPMTIQLAITHMTDIVGGKNAMGLQENAAESGAAVRARQEAAGLSRLPIFTNLNRWRRKVSELMLWYMKNYLTEGQQLRIIGAGGAAKWIDIDATTLDTLRNARTDIVVTEAIDSDTMRERQFIQVKELFQTLGGSVPPDLMMATLLEYSSLPQETKDNMMGRLQSIQQFEQQKKQEEEMMKLEESVRKTILRKQMKEEAEAQQAMAAMGAATPNVGAQ